MKLPFFEFYPTDWLSSTRVRLLSLEQRGAFLELLCHAWNYPGTVLPDPEHSYQDSLKTLSGLFNEKALQGLLDTCFKQVEGGWLNPKLRGIREKAERIYLAKSTGGKSKTHTKTHTKTPPMSHEQPKPKPQGSSSSSSDEAEGVDLLPKSAVQKDSKANQMEGNSKRGRVEPSPDAFRLSEVLADLILERKPDFLGLANGKRGKVVFSWALEFDRMLRIDGRKGDRAEEVLRWSQADVFWNKNILSADKFRKQYDRLEMKMREGEKNGLQASSCGGQGRESAFEKRERLAREAKEGARRILGWGPGPSPVVHADADGEGGPRKVVGEIIDGSAVEVDEAG